MYVDEVLAPSLRPGQIVVMDNLTAHKGGRVRELIEGQGCEVVYLPPYSPDFNPIEQAFSKLKASLCKAGAGTREVLIGAMGAALSTISARNAWGFFGHWRLPNRGPTAMPVALDDKWQRTELLYELDVLAETAGDVR